MNYRKEYKDTFYYSMKNSENSPTMLQESISNIVEHYQVRFLWFNGSNNIAVTTCK